VEGGGGLERRGDGWMLGDEVRRREQDGWQLRVVRVCLVGKERVRKANWAKMTRATHNTALKWRIKAFHSPLK
jgi:hypothetical protein